MIIGIGCDIVEVDRVARAVARPGFAQRVFTPAERTYCDAANGSVQAQRYAARFAAKEAALKALGTGLREGSLQELEIVHDDLGAPHLRVSGRLAELARAKGGMRWLVSLSHVQACAMAQVVLEGDAQVAQ